MGTVDRLYDAIVIPCSKEHGPIEAPLKIVAISEEAIIPSSKEHGPIEALSQQVLRLTLDKLMTEIGKTPKPRKAKKK